MLRIALIAIVVVAGLSALYFFPSVETITAPEKAEDVVRVEVKDELTERVASAQAAAMETIESEAKAAYEAAKTQALKEIELDVITAYRKEVEAKETQLSKEVGAY